ncbi:hypothetical protein CORC01_07747 [Colletotrichum orchidophilum]|uniref:Thioredoxin reductase n=1 Tax=Colletotrichum orchidophilum TaxID=1209926 RepID=A0A1G4B6N5_9PEZI|nr:uncharacterized protein CORC01_07747 [Colletotrichum orchidophilum]OHE96962.1 hypothetical protein CORC01_07747 [Colletotrichum orchidophilum]
MLGIEETSESFVESIASALKASKIPCVLWGHCLLNVYGVPSIIGSIDFVVPDQLISVGADVISDLPDLQQCPSVELCLASSPERRTPPPTFHVHIKGSEVTIGLYLQSETLWFLPTLEESLLSVEDTKLSPTFALACDRDVLPPWRPGRGSGAFKSSNSSVVVPKSHVLLEAYLRLYARDSGKPVGSFAMAMIGYMEQYVDDDGLLDANQLPEPLKSAYKELRLGEKPTRQWMKELKHSLNVPDEVSEDEDLW